MDLLQFKNEVVLPALIEGHLAEAFPRMDFREKHDRWVSAKHLDGSPSHSKDQTYIYKNGTTLHDNNGAQVGLFDFAMQQFRKDFAGTLQELAKICGLPMPDKDPLLAKKMEAAKRRQESLTSSMQRQQAALFAPEGKQVLEYLHKRGYDDYLIKQMGVGYLSAEEAKKLSEIEELPYNIADFPLAIPYNSRGKLRGFKFRYTSQEAAAKYGGGKYRNTKSLNGKMNGFPFLFEALNVQEEVIIVEGEMDALHAHAMGVKNIVPTSGGKLSAETLYILQEGTTLKRVIFVPDNDDSGRRFVVDGIKLVEDANLRAYVATLPEWAKDADEYLCKASTGDFNALINAAERAKIWEWRKVETPKLIEEYGDEPLEGKQKDKAEDEMCTFANTSKDEMDREQIISEFAALDERPNYKDYLLARANQLREEEATRLGAAKAKAGAETYAKLVSEGKIADAYAFMATHLAEQKKLKGTGQFSNLLHIPTRAEFLARFRDRPAALETPYQFTEGGGALPLTIPTGALTIIAAPTSHGKSAFLRNLALDVATRYNGDKSVLYFTFEECQEDVTAQFANTYINLPLHAPSSRHTQLETIANYYRTGETKYIAENVVEDFKRKEKEFYNTYIEGGKIRIYYKDYTLETLIDALEFATSKIKTKAIFIDYIQILRAEELAKKQRNEQLKEICIQLKDFAVTHKLPIVIAAQLTRSASSPFQMDNTKISESSDIEKAANTIICVWNSAFRSNELDKKEESELAKINVTLGQGGKLFAKITKRRGGRGVGMHTAFDFDGQTGKIKPNYDPTKEASEEPKEEPKEKPSNPF